MTDAEARLWFHLRDRRMAGFKFRRQFAVGRFVADFACVERALIVELDGAQHADSAADAARTRQLETEGFAVLRFWNDEILERTEHVLEKILAALGPSPCPSPHEKM